MAFVDLFTTQGPPPKEEEVPDGFEAIFPRPVFEDFTDSDNPSLDYRIARTLWEQRFRNFDKLLPVDQLTAQTFEQWGFESLAYEEKSGRKWWVLKGGLIDPYRNDYESTKLGPHLVIARYQTRLLVAGIEPDVIHPFVPPHLVDL